MVATIFGARGQQSRTLTAQEVSVIIHWPPVDPCTESFPEKMPWHNVGVVFHNRENDLITRGNAFTAKVLSTRLIASVALQVKMISSFKCALTSRATLVRAPSYASVAAF
ncbi:hypothetical protein XI09_08680 [Bradyrhizobium sp. CCBAU 11386]|nr:hypothetical protein [Bradyrhizobium sp. CCBAU 11386]